MLIAFGFVPKGNVHSYVPLSGIKPYTLHSHQGDRMGIHPTPQKGGGCCLGNLCSPHHQRGQRRRRGCLFCAASTKLRVTGDR